MATTQGRRTQELLTSLHSPNILNQIVFVDGELEEAGFLALFNEIPDFPTFNKEFKHEEDTWLPLTDTTTAAVSGTTQQTIQVTTPLAYIPETLWYNKRTTEMYFVQSVNEQASEITVDRQVGRNSTDSTGTAAAAINNGDTLIRIGPSQGEVSRRQIVQSTTPTEVSNFSEKHRWEMSMSDVQRKTELETGADWEYQLDKVMKQARKDLNGWLYLGQKNKKTINNQQAWMSGGIDFFIASNIHTITGTMHEYDLDSWLADEAMRFGPTTKTCFASMGFIKGINQIGKDRTEISRVNFGGNADLGMQVLTYTSPSGRTLNIIEDRFLTEALNGNARVIDMGVVRMRHFSNNGIDGRIGMKMNTQDVDADDFAVTIQGDIGPEWGPEKHHGKISGVSSGASGRAVS